MAELSGDRQNFTRIASGDLSSSQFRFLLLTNRDVHLAASSGESTKGVLQNKPQDNEHATVTVHGFTKITMGESLGISAFVMTNDSGYAIACGSGQACAGYTVTEADSGNIGEMFYTFTGTA